MATKAFLANVMDAYVYAGKDLLFTSKALTDSSISIAVTAEEVRGGKSNKLLGRFFHDSSFSMELQDALFNLDYIAHNVGAQAVSGNHGALAEEQVIATGAGALTVTGTPQGFLGQGTIGWVALPGSDEWNDFTFTGSSATNVTLKSGAALVQGDTYCVKYMNNVACDEIVVPADIIPDEVSVILKGDLYKASKTDDPSSVVGHIEVEVPRFQLNGSMDIALNSSGASQIPFAGSALVTMDASAGCEGGGYYAKIRRIDVGAQWYDNLVAFAMEGSDVISLATSAEKKINTYAVFANGSSRLADPADLQYTVTPTTLGTVDATGKFTAGSSTGTGTILVGVKGAGGSSPKQSVSLTIGVTIA